MTVRSTVRHTEEALLGLAAGGDDEAWSTLIDRLQPSVWAAAGSLGLPGAAATAVCELVWLRLAQRLDDTALSPRAWLINAVEAEAGRWHRAGEPANDGVIRLDDRAAQPCMTSD